LTTVLSGRQVAESLMRAVGVVPHDPAAGGGPALMRGRRVSSSPHEGWAAWCDDPGRWWWTPSVTAEAPSRSASPWHLPCCRDQHRQWYRTRGQVTAAGSGLDRDREPVRGFEPQRRRRCHRHPLEMRGRSDDRRVGRQSDGDRRLARGVRDRRVAAIGRDEQRAAGLAPRTEVERKGEAQPGRLARALEKERWRERRCARE